MPYLDYKKIDEIRNNLLKEIKYKDLRTEKYKKDM